MTPFKTLPADLPTDWNAAQAITPDGSGLSEKHGYNYLMQQVNDAQVGVNTLQTHVQEEMAAALETQQHNLDELKMEISDEWNRQNDLIETLGEATKTRSIPLVLKAANWQGETEPYTQTLAVSGLTTAANGIVGLAQTATIEQRGATRDAVLSVAAQAAESLTFLADGDKPEIDIPITLILMR